VGRFLADDELDTALWDFECTALRLELQPVYAVGEEPLVQRYLAGDTTPPDWHGWWSRGAAATAAGKRIVRVRVFEEPPTDYQRWLRWVSRWNIDAGEEIRYMTRGCAHDVGLLPAAGPDDWWLYDSSRLMVLRFDASGRFLAAEIVTEPDRIEQACGWWDLAVQHSTPDTPQGEQALTRGTCVEPP
jgi:hypothetical protein